MKQPTKLALLLRLIDVPKTGKQSKQMRTKTLKQLIKQMRDLEKKGEK